MALRFRTYLVKPWDELNLLLSQRFAFQPEMSDVTRHAGALAVAIMMTAGEAISYWVRKLKLAINWSPTLAEGLREFHEEAFLYFNPKYQISMSATNLQIVRRNANGDLVPYDTPELRFAVYEQRDEAT